uniref:Uncharacterized protein n=1 Tax=Fopius arisanus TaxID=64838 RepID=A0A0C9R0V7_9HYME
MEPGASGGTMHLKISMELYKFLVGPLSLTLCYHWEMLRFRVSRFVHCRRLERRFKQVKLIGLIVPKVIIGTIADKFIECSSQFPNYHANYRFQRNMFRDFFEADEIHEKKSLFVIFV